MMNRDELLIRLKAYEKTTEIQHALDILGESSTPTVSSVDIGRIWDRVSVAIDHSYSDDDANPLLELETELSQAITGRIY